MNQKVQRQIDIVNQRINELDAVYRIAAGKSGISDGEIGIWSMLLNADLYSQQDLCDRLYLPKQTVNSIVSNLSKRGFVVLKHVPGTRNRKTIQLTAEGMDYGKNRVMWIFEAEQRALEETDPLAVQACVSMFERYIGRFREEIAKR